MPIKDSKAAEKKLLDTLSYLKEQGLKPEEIFDSVRKLLRVPAEEEIKVPISVFKNNHLGSLEAIVKYLRENLLLNCF
mgnify:FL=1